MAIPPTWNGSERRQLHLRGIEVEDYLPSPGELPQFSATVLARLQPRLIEIETEEMDPLGAEMTRQAYRPIAIGEPAEIEYVLGWRGLRGRDDRTVESGYQLHQPVQVVTMGMDDGDATFLVAPQVRLDRPVQVGHENIRSDAALIEDRGGRPGRDYGAPPVDEIQPSVQGGAVGANGHLVPYLGAKTGRTK